VVPYEHNIVLGKPFGHAAYYYIWEKLGYIQPQRYFDGVRHSQIDFVDYADVTLGNALGVASGIEMGNERVTWVNISDSQLQMGPTLEAIQFIGRNRQNIRLTIDYNRKQLTGDLMTNLESDVSMFRSNGWDYHIVDENYQVFDMRFHDNRYPTVFFMKTRKGEGVPEMILNSDYWHYRPIKDEELTVTRKLMEI
jgi:transketolase